MRRPIENKLLLLIFIFNSLIAFPLSSCLTFCLNEDEALLYGRNFDWQVDEGKIFINKRGIKKTSFILPPNKPLSWVSKYGSLTFNQFSIEMPVGGMNEKGLVIESLVLTSSKYPGVDKRYATNELQWIQYLLDTCDSIAEVLNVVHKIRISPYAVRLHYFLSDRKGNCAAIEYIGGKCIIHTTDLKSKVLANTAYSQSKHRGNGRFAKADRLLKKITDHKNEQEKAFRILDHVAQGDFTKWQMVYDIKKLNVTYRTLRSPKFKFLKLSDYDFNNKSPVLMLDINVLAEGQIKNLFVNYDENVNDQLIKKVLKEFRKNNMLTHIKSEHVAFIKKIISSFKPI